MDKRKMAMYSLAIIMGLATFYSVDLIRQKNMAQAWQPIISDLTGLKDGNYKGSFVTNSGSIDLSVDIIHGQLSNITLLNHKGIHIRTFYTLAREVYRDQSLQPTPRFPHYSTYYITFRALENALMQAR